MLRRFISRRAGERSAQGSAVGEQPGDNAAGLDAPIASPDLEDGEDTAADREGASPVGETGSNAAALDDEPDASRSEESQSRGSANARGARTRLRFGLIASSVVVVVLGGLIGFVWFRAYDAAVAAQQCKGLRRVHHAQRVSG